jgi:lipopolysaccharide/colanic/teichoic acid biosynthesis glycosyltransferase
MIDIIISLLLILFLSPLIIIVTFLLTIINRGFPFYFQKRPGKHQKLFRIVKFKTMTDAKDKNGELLPDYLRITLIGKIIRKLSIDELPQLFNVLTGQMSLIGPRPLLEEYLPLYNKQQKKRHHIRPGITGWAQVNGRNAISWEQKFNYDVYYVGNLNFMFDVKIFILTIKKVFKGDGINQTSNITMEKFNGSN